MKKIFYFNFALLLIMTVFTQTINAQDKYNLEYKYLKGSNYLYRIKNVLQSEQAFMDQVTPSSGEGKSILRFNIADFQKGIYSIYVSSDSAYSKTETGVAGTLIDNGEKIRGKRIQYSVDKLGAVSGKKFVDSLTTRNITAVLGVNLLHKFSGKELKTGEMWNAKSSDTVLTVGSIVKINSSTDYKIEGKEKINGCDCLRISYVSNSAYNGSTKAIGNINGEQAEFTINIDGKAKTTGVFYFDLNRGIIIADENEVKSDETIVPNEDSVITRVTTYKTTINILE